MSALGLDSENSNDMWNDESDNQGDLQFDFTNQLKLQSTTTTTTRRKSANDEDAGDDDGDNEAGQDEDDDDVQRSNYKNLASQLLWSNPSVADLSSVDPWGNGELSNTGTDAWANFGSSASDNFADFDSHFADFGQQVSFVNVETATDGATASNFPTNPFVMHDLGASGEDSLDSFSSANDFVFGDDQNVPDLNLDDSNDEIIT